MQSAEVTQWWCPDPQGAAGPPGAGPWAQALPSGGWGAVGVQSPHPLPQPSTGLQGVLVQWFLVAESSPVPYPSGPLPPTCFEPAV